jgi:hypothetical protein
VEGERPSTAVDNKGISGMRAKRFAVEDYQNWMVIALGARVSEDGEGVKKSLAKV